MILPKIPYPFFEFLGMVKRRYSPPVKRSEPVENMITFDHDNQADLWIGFVGDICPIKNRKVKISERIVQFFDECSILVGNFEGVVTDKKDKPFLLKHTPVVFEVMEMLKPLSQWSLSIANNHAVDFGLQELENTISLFDELDIRWFGSSEKPSEFIHKKISVTGWTWWINGSADFISKHDPGALNTDLLNIATPHWGYEHERKPRKSQRELVPESYDLIVGHHSHLPQPLEYFNGKTPIAWSLGNFVTANKLRVLGEGALLKVGVVLNQDKKPKIHSIMYKMIKIDLKEDHVVQLIFM